MSYRNRLLTTGAVLWLCMSGGLAHADSYSDALTVFKEAGKSASYFKDSYAYAVFPNIGEGGFVVGGAHGDGRVYVHGHLRGHTSMSQVSVGFLAGGKAFSQVIFFQDARALHEFESGHFQFGRTQVSSRLLQAPPRAQGRRATPPAQAGESMTPQRQANIKRVWWSLP